MLIIKSLIYTAEWLQRFCKLAMFKLLIMQHSALHKGRNEHGLAQFTEK